MAEIRIDRSLDQVWSVFTDISTWKTWWGGDLQSVTPTWRSGAKIIWGGGGGTSVFDFVEKKLVGLKGSYGEKVIWTFGQVGGGGTFVTIDEDNTGSGLVSDAAARQEEFTVVLRKLKTFVEGRYPAASVAHSSRRTDSGSKRLWWKFWAKEHHPAQLLSDTLKEAGASLEAPAISATSFPRTPGSWQERNLGSANQRGPLGDKITVTCPGCGHVYRLGIDAFVITTEGFGSDFSFQIVIGDEPRNRPDDPDGINMLGPGHQREDVHKHLPSLRRELTKGGTRYWKCWQCKRVSTYSEAMSSS